MFTIFFGNTAIKDATVVRQCQCTDKYDAFAVLYELCRRFLVVEVYDSEGNKVRAYNNLP